MFSELPDIDDAVERVLMDEQEISKCCDRLAEEIIAYYKPKNKRLIFVGVLKGAFMFTAELMKRIHLPVELYFIKAQSYGAASRSSGSVSRQSDIDEDTIKDSNVLLIEDILDSGHTLNALVERFERLGASNVDVCVLLDKPSRREVMVGARFVGAEIPDAFVVGFGLDYGEHFRNLPYVGVLKKEIYQN